MHDASPPTPDPVETPRERELATALASAEARARHFERWFTTVDAQLRVLDRERQKFLALVNRGDTSFMVLGNDARVKWVNAEMGRAYEARGGAPHLIGLACNDVCGHAEGPCADCPVRRVLTGAAIAHQEREHESPTGARQLYVTAIPIRDPAGAVEEVLVTLQDLTDLEVLRRSEHRLRKLFDRSADAILMVEPATLRVLLTNSTAQSMLGSSASDLERLTLRDLHPPAENQRIAEHYEQLQQSWGAPSQDLEVITATGEALVCNVGGALFELEGNQVLMVEMRDVTRMRSLERELAHADRLASLGTMSAGIAHEFKNRLAPLRGLAQLLTNGSASDASRVQRYAHTLLEEVDRLAALVRDVLDFARPQAARRCRQDLAALTRHVVDEFHADFESELLLLGLRVRCEAPEGAPVPVSVDSDQLRRVFQNILKNAMEASPEGGEIVARVTIRGLQARISVVDNGTGIPADVRNRIFDPFFTTKGARGTGLGMCIVKSLVESNGGSIALENVAGGGTEVRMSFELHEPERRAA